MSMVCSFRASPQGLLSSLGFPFRASPQGLLFSLGFLVSYLGFPSRLKTHMLGESFEHPCKWFVLLPNQCGTSKSTPLGPSVLTGPWPRVYPFRELFSSPTNVRHHNPPPFGAKRSRWHSFLPPIDVGPPQIHPLWGPMSLLAHRLVSTPFREQRED